MLPFYTVLVHHSTVIDVAIAVERQWVGSNAWDDVARVQVALGVQPASVVEFVMDRMCR